MSHANYAVVKSGTVTNMIVVDEDIGFQMDNADVIKATVDTRIGGSWDGNVFSYVEPTPPADTRTYVVKRADEYPSIGDQLDMLWHAIDSDNWTAAKVKTTDFYTQLKTVKDANPKP